MKCNKTLSSGLIASAAVLALGTPAWAATTMQIGASGKTYASSAVHCSANPATGEQSPVIEAGLFNPKRGASANVSLNGDAVATVTADSPATNVWLADGNSTVVVALSKKTADHYVFAVQPGLCALPDTSGNTFSADDVRCTHGATVGQLEQEPLFYLKSRGIPQAEAEKIVVEGFFDPIFQRIPSEGVPERFQKYIADKMA